MNLRRIAQTGGVLTIAATIGFVMQSGEAAKARYAAPAPVPELAGTQSDPLELSNVTLTSAAAGNDQQTAKRPAAGVQTAALGDADLALPSVQDDGQTALTGCDVMMTAAPDMAAMVSVEVNAPCYPNASVTLHHNGMMFSELTDAQGNLRVMIPALSENAVFISAFDNGEGALVSTQVAALPRFDRKVVQSKRHGNLHIQAYEFGADFGARGHVNAASKRDMVDAAEGTGGFVTVLGAPEIKDGLVAEVYTFPIARSAQAGDVQVTVEADVTTSNCGLQIEAQTLEVHRGGAMKVQDLTLPIPSCDAVGDFLVLQNLLGDLKVALN